MISNLFDAQNRSPKRVAMVGLVVVMFLFAGCGGAGGGGDNGTNGTVAGANGSTAAADAETTAESGEETATESGMTETATATATATPTATETTTATPTPTATATETVAGNTSTNATTAESAGTTETALGGLDMNATPSGPDDDQYYLDRLEAGYTQLNLTVESFEMEENTVALEYVTNASNQTAVAYEIGLTSGGFAGALGEGWNAERMNVTAVTAEGEPVRTFHIESSWARQLNTEEITSTEYFNMVYETAETASGGNETTTTATAAASA